MESGTVQGGLIQAYQTAARDYLNNHTAVRRRLWELLTGDESKPQ
jgi:hypothetical protein